MISQERIKEIFAYDPITGIIANRIDRGRTSRAGERAGTVNGNGYRQIYLSGTIYLEHRLIWYYVHGYFPIEIDHVNGDRSDNRLENLREATRTQNHYNAERQTGTSGLRGVSPNKYGTAWRSRIWVDGQEVSLGEYSTAEDAYQAYLTAAELHYGKFAFHNRPTQLE